MADIASQPTAPAKVLDVAASHGLFGMAFARRNAATKIVAQDFATVLDVTRAKVTAAFTATVPFTIAKRFSKSSCYGGLWLRYIQ